MDVRLVAKLLSVVAVLVAAAMAFSLPWALPQLGAAPRFEAAGFFGLTGAIAISLAVASVLWSFGRPSRGQLYRKEAMAVVGLSWVLATLLGAAPYLLSGTARDRDFDGAPLRMNLADAIFEAQSGFSTTGATVLTNLEDPDLVPRCILFWRASTQFLGGLGIIVLFVAVLGQGSAGKALMRAEMPGPTKEGAMARMQHTAWAFAGIYCVLNAVLVVLLTLEGLSIYDALCHAFTTISTGGFSTYNDSIGHFAGAPGLNAPLIEATIAVFMVASGTNFALLYFVSIGQPKRLLADAEWRVYLTVLVGISAAVAMIGYWLTDFASVPGAIRYSVFQVVSIMTTTGFGTADFDQWNSFGRGILFLLMFIGGCAGSTAGGIKVIRHVLFLKILRLEIEQAYHPTVVRPLRVAGDPVEDPNLRKNIMVYFSLILVIFVYSWILLVAAEPDETWVAANVPAEHKLIDAASGVAATLNNIGPGLGIVGAKRNYAYFSQPSKILFSWLMLFGRLELFVVLVLFVPGFWRRRG
jgi:trk system potassium uptake protein